MMQDGPKSDNAISSCIASLTVVITMPVALETVEMDGFPLLSDWIV